MTTLKNLLKSSVARYTVAIVAVGVALLLRQVLVRWGGELPHYVTFYPAIMLTAILAGIGPGLFATGLAAVAAAFWVIAPYDSFLPMQLNDAIGLGLFLCMGIFMNLVAELYHRSCRRAAVYERQLAVEKEQVRAAAETARQRELLAVTLASIGDGVIVTDSQGRVTFLNAEAERLTGWSTRDATGRPLSDVFPIVNEYTRQAVENPAEKVLRLGITVGLANHTLLLAKDGREIPIDDSGAPVRSTDGVVHGVVLVFRDFTAKKRDEALLRTRLRLSEMVQHAGIDELIQTALDEAETLTNSSIGYFHLVDGDQQNLTLQCWSTNTFRNLCRAEGKGLHYPISKAGVWVDCFHAKRPVIHNDYACLSQKKGLPEGHVPLVRDLGVPIFRGDQVVALIGVGNKTTDYTQDDVEVLQSLATPVMDLVAYLRAEEQIRRQNAVLEGISRIFHEALHCETEEQLGRACLAAAEELTQSKFGFLGEINADGLLENIAISDPGWEACRMPDAQGDRKLPQGFKVHGLYGWVLKNGKSYFTNTPSTDPDRIGLPAGHPPLEAFLGVPLVHRSKTIGIVAVGNREGGYRNENLESLEMLSRVIIEALMRKRSEQALAREQSMLSAVLNGTDVMHAYLDRDFNFVLVNPAYAETCKMRPEEMIGKNHFDLYPHEENEAIFRRVRDTGVPVFYKDKPFEFPDQPERGTTYWDWSLAPIKDASGRVVGLAYSLRETTKYKQAEKALRRSERRYRSFVDVTNQFAWVTDVNGLVQEDVPALRKFTGQTYEQARGTGWSLALYPDDLAPTLEVWQQAVSTKTQYEHEYRMRRHDGEYRRLLARGVPILDGQGNVVEWVGTCIDITERKAAEEALRQAKIAAEAASEAKSRFLANISHELRTPMNAILGMVELALPKQMDPTATDLLQTAKNSADLLLALLNDLLDTAKIESGKLELESAPFSLRHVLSQTAQVLSVRASEKGIAFACQICSDVPDAFVGDQVRLRQILLNLAGNGIKFTDTGEVTIRVGVDSQDSEGACLKFAVDDTGIGISSVELDRLFQPFTQADPSTTRRFGGTGLGLSICSRLAEMMGGRIRVESTPARGSTFFFTVRLPLAKEPVLQAEESDVLAKTSSALRILLVEDNPANQKLASFILKDRGHRVDIAGDGQEAVRYALDDHYDVILMDVQMPGMDGLEATKAIRAQQDGERRTPIIAMTAHAMKGDRERCLAVGMDGYLSKPIDRREMIPLIESLAARAAQTANQTEVAVAPNPLLAEIFDLDLALKQCFDSRDLLADMVRCFFDDLDNLFPQIHAALQKGDLREAGRLAHRLKGTLVYLGAKPAQDAAKVVEKFQCHDGDPTEAETAVKALECECQALKTRLAKLF